MIDTTWERAEAVEFPILWWRTYADSLPVLETRRKTAKAEKRPNVSMFDDLAEVAIADDVIASGERRDYYMRLPYTAQALANRAVNGGDLPTVLSGQIAVIEVEAVKQIENEAA